MRVVICGQKWFGAEALTRIGATGAVISRVVAPDDDDRLAKAAQERGIPVRTVAAGGVIGVAETGDADLIVTAHCHNRIGKDARTAALYGAIGYHPSLLPRHPGRDAVAATIRARDPIAGGTIYRLTSRMDAGPIIYQALCAVAGDDDAATLWRRALAPIGLMLLEVSVRGLCAGQALPVWHQ